MREKWNQLWAAFSVKDHCTPGAFIAEVFLYDHLLIPVVPMRRDGLSADEASEEWNRWKANGWEPARLNQLVAILGERATPIPWTKPLQQQWHDQMQSASTASTSPLTEEIRQARANGYVMTGSVLEKFAPCMAQTFVAVSQYRSLEDLERAMPVRRVDRPAFPVPAGSLLAVLGHELLVPEDPDRDDYQLLTEAVDVSSNSIYRKKRKQLYLWQQEFVDSEKLTDVISIKSAVEQMSDLVHDLNAATGKQKVWKGVKTFFSFLKVGEKAAGFVEPTGAKAVGAFASVGDFVLDRIEPRKLDDDATPVASLLLDAQKRLGLTIAGERKA